MVVHEKQEGSRPPAFLCINAIKFPPMSVVISNILINYLYIG